MELQGEKIELFGVDLSEVGKRSGQFTPVSSIWKRRDYNSGAFRGEMVEKTWVGMGMILKAVPLWVPVFLLGNLLPPFGSSINTNAHYLERIMAAAIIFCGGASVAVTPALLLNCSKKHSIAVAPRTGYHRSVEITHPRKVSAPFSSHSSMEIAHYNPVISPVSSTEHEEGNGEPSYSLRTSTQLLKVLNRIWRHEEKQSSNSAVVKALKKELNQARSQIKLLLREQKADQQEIHELVKQIRRNKDQKLMCKPTQYIKMRKHSEDSTEETDDLKSAFRKVSEELEIERRSKRLLEELCDAFARGIRDYEREMHLLRQKSDKIWRGGSNLDQLLLHVAESWLDERTQIKLSVDSVKNSAVDNLLHEIEALIEAFGRRTVESIPQIGAASFLSEDDPLASDSNLFELEKTSKDIVKSQMIRDNETPHLKESKKKADISSAESSQQINLQLDEKLHSNEQLQDHKKGKQEICSMTNCEDSNHTFNNPMKNRHLLRELRNGKAPYESHIASTSSIRRNQPIPVRRWTGKLQSYAACTLKSSSKLPPDLKENSLEAKLFEARTKTKSKGSKHAQKFSM